MEIQEKFGKRVKELRQEIGLSQEAFAFKCNVDRTYMTGIETGKRNISIMIIDRVINGLEISYGDFFESEIFEK